MSRALFAALVAGLVFLPAGREGGARETTRKKTKWTVLFFGNLDCNLERAGMANLEGIAQATHSEEVTIVAQADRCAKDAPESTGYTGMGLADTIEGWTTAKRILFGKDGVQEIEDLGETNTGDPNTAAEFIAWGVKNYPADKYAIVFWDHGAAWVGWGGDEGNKNDGLRLSEIGAALQSARDKSGIEKFDVLIFEACLMSSLEVARVVAPHAKYLVGSEEISYVGGGVYWKQIVKGLAENPDMDAEEMAKLFVNEWRGFFDNHRADNIQEMGHNFPLHVLDLTKIDAVVQATDALSEQLVKFMTDKGREGWLKVAGARGKSEEYGKMGNDTYHCRDLHQFASGLKGIGVDSARNAVMKAIEGSVVHNIAAQKRPGARGLSVCFAGTKKEYDGFVKRIVPDYPKWGASPKWAAMLDVYYKLAAEDTSSPIVKIQVKGTLALRRGEQAKFPTTLENDADVAEAFFFLGMPQEKSYIVIGQYPVPLADIRNSVVEFDGTWLAFGNDRLMLWASVISYDEIANRNYMVGVPVKYKAPGDDTEREITLFFTAAFDDDWKFTQGKYMYAYQFSENGPAPINLRPGGQVKSIYPVITETGKMERWPSRETVLLDKKMLKIKEIPLPAPAEYIAGYRLKDFSGNENRDYVKITLKK